MKRKETYLSRDFRETAAQRFPARAKELNTAFDMRLSALLAENADASKEKQYHLKRQADLAGHCGLRDLAAGHAEMRDLGVFGKLRNCST